MIKSKTDYAIVGNNYLSYILSISLLKKSKSVLVLDDERFNHGDFFANSLTLLDLCYLKNWGNLNQLLPLISLETYLEQNSNQFYFGKKSVVLGRSPFLNLVELQRKFPKLFYIQGQNFPEEKFNQEFNDFLKSFSESLIINKKNDRFYFLAKDKMPSSLQVIFDHFLKNVIERNVVLSKNATDINDELSLFIYLARGYFHSHFSINGSKAELFHVFLSLLSPYYRLNYIKLTEDLSMEFKNLGGEFRRVNLDNVKIQNDYLKDISLLSYEGNVTPKKLLFIGAQSIGMPISFDNVKNVYNCLNIELLLADIPEHLVGKRLAFSSALKLSTKSPMIELYFQSETKIIANIVIFKRNGTKIKFVREQIIADLIKDIQYLFPYFIPKIEDLEMSYTHDLFIEEAPDDLKVTDEYRFKGRLSNIIFNLGPMLLKKAQNVHYLGPFNDSYLGTMSSLLEIERWNKLK